jgi:hypothetical protein
MDKYSTVTFKSTKVVQIFEGEFDQQELSRELE